MLRLWYAYSTVQNLRTEPRILEGQDAFVNCGVHDSLPGVLLRRGVNSTTGHELVAGMQQA